MDGPGQQPPRVPAHPGELEPGWLAEALGHGPLREFHARPIGRDRGFTGELVRIELRYERTLEHVPRTVVAKFPLSPRRTTDALARTRADDAARERAFRTATNETRFYAELAGEAPLRTPRMHHFAVDAERRRVALLFEDLGPAALRPGDALTGCSAGQARSVVTDLAALQNWFDAAGAASAGWLERAPPEPELAARRYASTADRLLERFGDTLPEPVPRRLAELRPVFATIRARADAAPVALQHGDLHLDNLLFPTDDDAVCWIDWPSIHAGPRTYDLARFVVPALVDAAECAHAGDVLELYRAARGIDPEEFALELADQTALAFAAFAAWAATGDPAACEDREAALLRGVTAPGGTLERLARFGSQLTGRPGRP